MAPEAMNLIRASNLYLFFAKYSQGGNLWTAKSITFSSVKSFNFRGHTDIQSNLVISTSMGLVKKTSRYPSIRDNKGKIHKVYEVGIYKSLQHIHCIWGIYQCSRFWRSTVLCFSREFSWPSSSNGFTMIYNIEFQYF